MEKLLKNYLVEHTDEKGIRFSVTCMVCGESWLSGPMTNKDAGAARETAAQEASDSYRVCQFCVRPVCDSCFTEIEGISLCVQCGEKLRRKLEA